MSNVSPAKPGVGGGVWLAPFGSTLPTDASTALDQAFKSMGYVDENGVTRNISRSNTVVHAWGGDPVAVLSNQKTETFKFKCIEPSNVDVLGLTFGEASGTLAAGITVKSRGDISTPHAFVISTIMSNNVHQRIVIPQGVVTDIGEIVYRDNALVGFDLTITGIADEQGNTAYEYQKTITAAANAAAAGNDSGASAGGEG